MLFQAILSSPAAESRDDVIFADFEGADYGGWQTKGEAFGSKPARGTLPGQMAVSGFAGNGLVNSFNKGDASVGTLTSPEFTINRKFIGFLIGGGGFAGKTCMNLLVDGQAVRTATGPNTQSGGSEQLLPSSWDVSDFAGKTARLQIVDEATGGWGHINLDQIVFTDRKPPGLIKDARRELVLQQRYLNFPVTKGAPSRRITMMIDNAAARDFDIELAEDAPEWWAPLDVSAWKGKKATLRVDKLPENSTGLSSIDESDELKDAANIYHESLRPQLHFSPRRGWNNDPNGLVFSQGEYHLYFQHNPYGWNWGNMHWGHAVSRDLVHWEELPIAMYPKKYGDWAFSGSAVVDKQNTSGWKRGENDLLVAAFTSTGRGECIVYSNDRGRTWKEFEGNPVVKHQGRDPKLVWHEPTHRWVMALYDEQPTAPRPADRQCVAFYTSADLKTWTFQSRIGGFFECPDLFELPVDGDRSTKKWVLTAANSEYMIGSFDGKTFKPETLKLPGQRGDGFYAAQTFSDMPDGRRVQIGWGQYATPALAFNQMMCFPCELTLREGVDGLRMCFAPVKELASLRGPKQTMKAGPLQPGANELAGIRGELLELQAEFEPGGADEVGFKLHGTSVIYDTMKQELVCKNHRVPLKPIDGKIRLQMLVDRTSLEIFGNDGWVYMPVGVNVNATDKLYATIAKGGSARLNSLVVHELKPIWE
jgi:fructan beta-fructosidase